MTGAAMLLRARGSERFRRVCRFVLCVAVAFGIPSCVSEPPTAADHGLSQFAGFDADRVRAVECLIASIEADPDKVPDSAEGFEVQDVTWALNRVDHATVRTSSGAVEEIREVEHNYEVRGMLGWRDGPRFDPSCYDS